MGHVVIELDETDRAIINELQLDGRTPYSQLAPKVGLSEAATRQRVNRLVERGAMQVVAVTDPTTLGFDYSAMCGMNVAGDVTAVAAALSKFEEVSYLVITAGRYDILFELVCRDADHVLAVLNDDVRPLDGVISTEVFSYLRLVKQSYSWGVR